MTTTILLDGLRDPANEAVWGGFVGRYRPLLLQYAMRLGLRPSDAEDVSQAVLTEFSTAYRAGKYDRQRGRLRDWLFGIARNQAANWRRKLAARREVQPDRGADHTDYFAAMVDENEWESMWEEEWRDAVMRHCLSEVKREVQAQTFEAFDLFACKGWPAERVAAHLKITENAVFGAKRRVLRRVRDLLPVCEATY